MYSPVFLVFFSLYPRAVGNQGLDVARKLLQSPVSFSFQLRGVANLAPRLKVGGNPAGARYGFFPFGQCFLACVQLGFALSKLLFSGRILLLAGANHPNRDEHRKDKNLFHIRSKL